VFILGTQTPETNMTTTDVRHQPCTFLQKAGIPCVIWFEDALQYYGVPTDVFSLYLLVADIDQAGQVFVEHGWIDTPEPPESLIHFLLLHPEIQRRRLNPPVPNLPEPLQMVSTVLLPAGDWHFPAQELLLNQFYPSLPTLTNSLISKLLDAPHGSRLQDTMSLYLVYLYGHVQSLKDPLFANKISYENRRFHNDANAGLLVGTLPIIEYERQLRDQLRNERT
jgi:hypothetical protein